jgi:AcrR family transcriptional regulator
MSWLADQSGHAPDGTPADVTEVITAMVQAYLHLVERDPDIYRFVVTRPLLDQDTDVPDPVLTLTGRIGDQLAAILTAHLERAGRDSRPAVTWAHGIVGFVRAAADHWVSEAPTDTTAADVTTFVVAMLRPALHGPTPDPTRTDAPLEDA